VKVRADEHVSPEIVAVVCRLALGAVTHFDHVYDAGDMGAADEHWITTFANNGGEAIITADDDFTSKPPQIVAVFKTGIKVIHMPHKWGFADGYLQAAFLLLWWPRIERQIQIMKKSECYRPEWNVSGKTGVWKKVEINFAKAHQKLRKSESA
jgi:hypothetical protein